MEVFKKILLIFSITVMTLTSAHSDVVNGEDHWPFPLGSECPFAWNFVSSADWQIELNGELQNISFYISEEGNKYIRIMTVVYDDEWNLLAYGSEVYLERSFILNLNLVDFRDDSQFSVKLRLYDNASKILPTEAWLFPPKFPVASRMCKNMSNISLAATVSSYCSSTVCGTENKNQILNKKED